MAGHAGRTQETMFIGALRATPQKSHAAHAAMYLPLLPSLA